MVSIIMLLAFSMGGFVLGQYDSAESDVHASVEFTNNADDAVTVKWTGKETAEQIVVTNETTTKTIDEFQGTATMWFGPNASDIYVFAERGDTRSVITKFDAPPLKSTVYAESSTCDDPGYCGSKIIYNGSIIFSNRGVNILVFKPDGSFHSYAWFDTHSNDRYKQPTYTLESDGTPRMNPTIPCNGCVEDRALNHLKSVPENYDILIVGDDQPGRIGEPLENEYERMGAKFSHDDELEYRDSWIIATKKTTDVPSGNDEYQLYFEKHEPRGDQSNLPKVTAYFYAPHDD